MLLLHLHPDVLSRRAGEVHCRNFLSVQEAPSVHLSVRPSEAMNAIYLSVAQCVLPVANYKAYHDLPNCSIAHLLIAPPKDYCFPKLFPSTLPQDAKEFACCNFITQDILILLLKKFFKIFK